MNIESKRFSNQFLWWGILFLFSYISLVPFEPPIAYILPSTTATPKELLAVGIGSIVVQESSVVVTGMKKVVRKKGKMSNEPIFDVKFFAYRNMTIHFIANKN